MLTSRMRSFCNSDALGTGLSDFHKLTVIVLKTFFQKNITKRNQVSKSQKFSNDSRRIDLINEIAMAF